MKSNWSSEELRARETGEIEGEGRKERWERSSNLWGFSPMPDEIHHFFDEERPWGADLMGGIVRGMAPICRSVLFRVPHHWKDRRIIRAGGSGEPSWLNLNYHKHCKGGKKSYPHLLSLGGYEDDSGKWSHSSNISLKNLSSLCHLSEVTASGEMVDGWGGIACWGPRGQQLATFCFF